MECSIQVRIMTAVEEERGRIFPEDHIVTEADRVRARRDWENVHKLLLITHGTHHAPFIKYHLDEGKHVVGFLTHQAHPDFAISLRVMNYLTGNKIETVGAPASSKLFPGGELYKTDGKRLLGFAHTFGVNVFKTVQDYMQTGSLGEAKTNEQMFKLIREFFQSKQRAYIGYFFEGGRGPGDGILRQALPGSELLFTSRRGDKDELMANDSVLGVPINLGDTRNLLTKKGKINYARVIRPFDVYVGQPFLARDLLADMEHFGHSFQDAIGARVASLMPSHLRGPYATSDFADLVSYSRLRNQQTYIGEPL